MPIYDFKCRKCFHTFEEIVSKSEVNTIKCVKCGYTADKIPSISNFHLKGSGWSKDGYSSKKETALDRVPR